MLGTFSPQAELYTQVMDEETTPAGVFARGTYSARTKVSIFYLLIIYFDNNSIIINKDSGVIKGLIKEWNIMLIFIDWHYLSN